jgi:hypothetical protein
MSIRSDGVETIEARKLEVGDVISMWSEHRHCFMWARIENIWRNDGGTPMVWATAGVTRRETRLDAGPLMATELIAREIRS